MDTRTGKIYTAESMTPDVEKELSRSLTEGLGNFVEIDMEDATPKQRETLQVSSYDNRSTLGKVYTQLRNERREFNALNIGKPRVISKKEKLLAVAKRKAAKKARKRNRK